MCKVNQQPPASPPRHSSVAALNTTTRAIHIRFPTAPASCTEPLRCLPQYHAPAFWSADQPSGSPILHHADSHPPVPTPPPLQDQKQHHHRPHGREGQQQQKTPFPPPSRPTTSSCPRLPSPSSPPRVRKRGHLPVPRAIFPSRMTAASSSGGSKAGQKPQARGPAPQALGGVPSGVGAALGGRAARRGAPRPTRQRRSARSRRTGARRWAQGYGGCGRARRRRIARGAGPARRGRRRHRYAAQEQGERADEGGDARHGAERRHHDGCGGRGDRRGARGGGRRVRRPAPPPVPSCAARPAATP